MGIYVQLKKYLFSILVVCATCCILTGSDLILNGDKPYAIHVAAGAEAVERTAAAELQHYLREMGQKEFPVVTEIPEGFAGIFLGHSAEVKERLPHIDLDNMAADEVVIYTVGDSLILSGDAPRGTLYAVYTLLEERFGVRWWTSQAESVPAPGELRVRETAYRYAPPFYSREVYYADMMTHPVFAARSKINGHFEEIPPEYGGHIPFLGWVHTFWQLLPSEKYFEAHPEWFSLINGKRIPGSPGGGQLCLTHPDMRAELVANAARWLRENPDSQLISISQNDVKGDACECPVCAEMAAREGQSGVLIDCVNYVATELEKEFPDVVVDTLAYYHTLEPPASIRPRHNVLIRFAPINSDFGRPLDGSGPGNPNRPFAEMLLRWRDIAPQLALWNYVSNFANDLLPHPNFRNIGRDLRFFAANNVKSVFEQGGPSESELSNFAAMRTWVIAKLLWNPELDQDSLLQEFARGYYGPAASGVLEVFEMIHEEHENAGGELRCSLHGSGLPLEKISAAQAVLTMAMTDNTGNPELLRRLRLAKSHFDFAWLDSLSPVWLSEEERQSGHRLLAELRQLVQQNQAVFYGENRNFADYLDKLGANLEALPDSKTRAVPDFCRGLTPEEWYEFGPKDFRLTIPGELTDIVPDAQAASGQVARLYSTSNWLLQLQIPRGTWDIMVSLRMDAQADPETQAATEIGIYNETLGRSVQLRDVDIADFPANEVRWLNYGTVSLLSGYLYIAPYGNPDLNHIDIERVILLRKP